MSDIVCIVGYALSRIIHRIQYEIYFGNMYSGVHFVPRRIYVVFGELTYQKRWKNMLE
jgi:hypothetical protein